MIRIANKIKNSPINKTGDEAKEMLNGIVKSVSYYTFFSTDMFENSLPVFDKFVEKFLNFHAYIGNDKGLKVPSYDPFEIAFTEEEINGEVVRYWMALWTNAFIVYSEYETSHHKNGLALAIENDYYNENIKKEHPGRDGTEQ